MATKGEYAGWRATGDFDLRTFAIRAYPIEGSTGSGPMERLCGLAQAIAMSVRPNFIGNPQETPDC